MLRPPSLSPAELKAKPKRKRTISPTQRSLALLRDAGWLAEVVEKRLPRCFITKDLFGFIDILAIRDGETLAVQTTSGDHLANRAAKIADAPTLAAVRKAGWGIHIHGWRKLKSSGRWECRTLDVS